MWNSTPISFRAVAIGRATWQRGTNKNTNGLLREYFPKGESLDDVSEEQVLEAYDKLNRRPCQRLGYRTPYKIHYSEMLHLVLRFKTMN